MIWVFDVDGTLIDSMTGQSLRPGAGAVLELLRERGHTVLLWSAGGADYARRRAQETGIAASFAAFHAKSERGSDGRYLTSTFLSGHHGVVFVDDVPHDLPLDADVIRVRPYLAPNPHDRGLNVAIGRASSSGA